MKRSACDRISLMHAGKVLACDAPDKLSDARGGGNLEQAFIAYIQTAEGSQFATSAPA